MEPNRTVSSLNWSAVGALSNNALDALLQIDSPPLTIPTPPAFQEANGGGGAVDQRDSANISVMQFNREQLPSQLNASDSSFRLTQRDLSFIPCLEQVDASSRDTTAHDENDPSLIISTQEVDQIVLDDTELPTGAGVPEKEQDENQTKQLTKLKQERLSSSFERELEKFQDDDFDMPELDFDFEHLNAVERSFRCHKDSIAPFQIGDVLLNAAPEHTTPFKEPSTKKELPPQASHNNFPSCPSPAVSSISESNITPNNPLATAGAIDLSSRNSNQPSPVISAALNDDFFSINADRPLDYSLRSDDVNEPAGQQPLLPSPPLLNFSATSHNNAFTAAPLQAGEVTDPPVAASFVAANDTSDVPLGDFGDGSATTADVTMIPSAVKQLYDVIRQQYSDYAFVYALSAQLCQERVPMDCFVNLKMGLLLSLASIGPNPDRPPIPIIAIGNDTYMANHLLTEIGQLAERFVGPTDDVKPPTSAGYRNHNWIVADPILLARGGVYYVGDWSRLKLARADKIFKDVECSRISIERSTDYPLETAIWTHWRSFKYNAKDQQTFNKFVKIFGIPLYMDDNNHDVLVNYVLEQASVRIFESTVDHLSISSDDMRSFLAVISKRTVDLNPESTLIMQKYFVASRSERPDCLTKQSFVVLKQFAESFAKLSFRHEVLPIDVVAAIYMCEHFIQNIFGASENPPPTFESHNFIGLVDGHMTQFQQWLDAYIVKHYDKE